MIYCIDRERACHLDKTNHGSWCWTCYAGSWLDGDLDDNDCDDCAGTSRDAIPWCELNMGDRR